MSTPSSAPGSSAVSTSSERLGSPDRPERVLVVHAHPDDETIVTGALLATLVDDGAKVTLVTCTRGELGEVLTAEGGAQGDSAQELAALRSDPALLAVHREAEIGRALGHLGVVDHRFLGSRTARTPGLPERAYRDSGMEWGPDGTPVPVHDVHPAAFCSAGFGEIVSDLAAVIADVRPDVVVSYDEDGGYGHPDHVRVHRASLRAARLAGLPFYAITGGTAHPEPALYASSDAIVVDGSAVLDRKVAALGEYRSQVTVVDTAGGPALEFPHGAVDPVTVVETFRLVPEIPDTPPPFPGAGGRGDGLGPLATGVAYGASLVVGALFGAIGTVAHQDVAKGFPLGAVVALVMVAALLIGFRLQFASRLAGVLAAVGCVAVVSLLSLPQSSGTVLVPANATGYAWLFGPTVIALVVLGWPRFPARRGGRIVGSQQASPSLPDAQKESRQ